MQTVINKIGSGYINTRQSKFQYNKITNIEKDVFSDK